MAIDVRIPQIDAMTDERRAELDRRMVERLRQRWPQAEQLAPPALLQLAAAGRVRARGFGIHLPDDLERFLGYLVRYGVAFGEDDATAWAMPILQRPAQPGRDKLDALDAAAPAVEAPCP